MVPKGKFDRKLPEERRRILIAATLACLEREGHAGASIRKISAEAGISSGLINHYYPSKDDLIADAYEYLTTTLLHHTLHTIETVGADPRMRMSAFIRGSLSTPTMDPDVLRAWVVFWGKIRESKAMIETHDRTYAEFRAILERLISDLTAGHSRAQLDPRTAAIGLNAVLDGLWLEWCLNPETFALEDGIRICEVWVDAVLLGKQVHRPDC